MTPSDHAFPERPSPRSAATVGPYAEAYERAHVYASISADGERDVRSLDLACERQVTALDAGDGYRVRHDCAYSYEGELDGRPNIADGAPYVVEYRVTADETVRTVVDDGTGRTG